MWEARAKVQVSRKELHTHIIKVLKLLFDQVIMDPKDETIRQKDIHIGINEIRKKVPRWSYKLIDELEQQERDKEDHVVEDHEIRSRKAKRVIILTVLRAICGKPNERKAQ